MIEDTIESVNQRISRMVFYGVIEKTAEANGYITAWSNGSASWYVYGRSTKKGEIVQLDANQMLVYNKSEIIKQWIAEKKLDILPLFANSYEARFGKL